MRTICFSVVPILELRTDWFLIICPEIKLYFRRSEIEPVHPKRFLSNSTGSGKKCGLLISISDSPLSSLSPSRPCLSRHLNGRCLQSTKDEEGRSIVNSFLGISFGKCQVVGPCYSIILCEFCFASEYLLSECYYVCLSRDLPMYLTLNRVVIMCVWLLLIECAPHAY